MKYFFFLFLTFIFFNSCTTNTQEKETKTIEINQPKKTDSTKTIVINPTITEKSNQLIRIPEFGLFEFKKSSIKRTNKYGAGDCFGIVKQYENLITDSMSCDPYGFEFSFYLVDDRQDLLLHRTLNATDIIIHETNQSDYILTETIYDFTIEPPTRKSRIDTIYGFYINKKYPLELNSIFTTDTLNDHLLLKDSINKLLNDSWELELDY